MQTESQPLHPLFAAFRAQCLAPSKARRADGSGQPAKETVAMKRQLDLTLDDLLYVGAVTAAKATAWRNPATRPTTWRDLLLQEEPYNAALVDNNTAIDPSLGFTNPSIAVRSVIRFRELIDVVGDGGAVYLPDAQRGASQRLRGRIYQLNPLILWLDAQIKNGTPLRDPYQADLTVEHLRLIYAAFARRNLSRLVAASYDALMRKCETPSIVSALVCGDKSIADVYLAHEDLWLRKVSLYVRDANANKTLAVQHAQFGSWLHVYRAIVQPRGILSVSEGLQFGLVATGPKAGVSVMSKTSLYILSRNNFSYDILVDGLSGETVSEFDETFRIDRTRYVEVPGSIFVHGFNSTATSPLVWTIHNLSNGAQLLRMTAESNVYAVSPNTGRVALVRKAAGGRVQVVEYAPQAIDATTPLQLRVVDTVVGTVDSVADLTYGEPSPLGIDVLGMVQVSAGKARILQYDGNQKTLFAQISVTEKQPTLLFSGAQATPQFALLHDNAVTVWTGPQSVRTLAFVSAPLSVHLSPSRQIVYALVVEGGFFSVDVYDSRTGQRTTRLSTLMAANASMPALRPLIVGDYRIDTAGRVALRVSLITNLAGEELRLRDQREAKAPSPQRDRPTLLADQTFVSSDGRTVVALLRDNSRQRGEKAAARYLTCGSFVR